MKKLLRRPEIALPLLLVVGILIKITGNFVMFYTGPGWKSALRVSPSLFMSLQFQEFKQLVWPNRRRGLPLVRLFIHEKSIKNLMKNPPVSLKSWQRGFMIYPEGRMQRVKVRIRGENLRNWIFPQKSWRVKTRHKHLIGRQRQFNYIRHRLMPTEDILPYQMAKTLGLPSPAARLVELFINDKSQGVYLELEKPNENFLRIQRRMPVNVYKGEPVDAKEFPLGPYHDNLFNDATAWSKSAINNRFPETDHHDLARFLNMVRHAENDPAALIALRQNAPFDIWARFAALQVLSQSLHNSNAVNIRLIFDDWTGHVTPMPWDTIFHSHQVLANAPEKCRSDCRSTLNFDQPSNELLVLYQRHSHFLWEKYQHLYHFIVDKKILKSLHQEMTGKLDRLHNSLQRDAMFSSLVRQEEVKKSVDALLVLERLLLKTLSASPHVTWQTSAPAAFQVGLQGRTPVGALTLSLKPKSVKPKIFALDRDGNGVLSPDDLVLPFHWNDAGHVVLDAVWLANRIRKTTSLPVKSTTLMALRNSLQATKFTIVADHPFQINALTGHNPLTHKKYALSSGKVTGFPPARWNVPVFAAKTPSLIVWKDRIEIEGTRHINQPVKIQAGTLIEMAPGANLVFHYPVQIQGTQTNPVRIRPLEAQKPWGVIALQGSKTAGSRLLYLDMAGGSGGVVNGIQYTGMFSIHNTHDIEIKGLSARQNHVFDDLVHVIYCQNIRFREIHLSGARSDALDIDISEQVSVQGGAIVKSGNDAMDFMDSRAFISNLRIADSGDKGISVGENSRIIAGQLQIEKNSIGIESKDASTIELLHSVLKDNETQLHAYKKNWRYGVGGRINVQKSLIHAGKNKISADKLSRININDTAIWPAPEKRDRSSFYEMDVDFQEIYKSHSSTYVRKIPEGPFPEFFSKPENRGLSK